MRSLKTSVALVACMWVSAQSAGGQTERPALDEEVRQTERQFAQTMARRDFQSFLTFVDSEAVFVDGRSLLTGIDAVAAGWKPYFEGDTASFSWDPDVVVGLSSGTLALSSGPVYDAGGKRIGTFNSVWRRDDSGRWKIVFDKGCPPCNCADRP